jgi:hypothetical protein
MLGVRPVIEWTVALALVRSPVPAASTRSPRLLATLLDSKSDPA